MLNSYLEPALLPNQGNRKYEFLKEGDTGTQGFVKKFFVCPHFWLSNAKLPQIAVITWFWRKKKIPFVLVCLCTFLFAKIFLIDFPPKTNTFRIWKWVKLKKKHLNGKCRLLRGWFVPLLYFNYFRWLISDNYCLAKSEHA